MVRGNEDRRNENGEGDINKEEIREAIRGLRDGKAAGCDGISGEYGNMEGRKWWSGGWHFCNRVWKSEG